MDKNPNVGRAGTIMMASLFLSRVLGLVRNAVIAGMFGQSLMTSAYRQSFVVPDLLFFLIAGGALSSAFIPVFSEYFHTGREDEAWHIFSAVTTVMTIVITVFIILAWIFALPLVGIFAHGSPETWPIAAQLSRIVLPAQLAFFIGGLMFGTLYARQMFSVPGLGPNIYNIGIIFGAVVVSHFVSPSVAGMSWGALVGAFIGNILIPMIAMRKVGARFKPTFDLAHPGVKKVFVLMLPVLLGLSLPAVFGIIMLYFGSYYGPKMPTALDNCDRIMQAPLAIFGQSFAIAAFPALSQFFSLGQMDSFKDQLSKSLRTVLYLSIPVSALLIAMPEAVIKVLLEHGKFTAEDTAINTPILRLFAIGVAAWCMHPVLMRAYFAVQQTLRPILISTACTGVFALLCIVLQQTPLKHLGLPLAGSIASAVLAIGLLFGIRKLIGEFETGPVVKTLLQCLLASAVMALPCWYVTQLMLKADLNKLTYSLISVFVGLCGVWVYIGLTRWMKMPETAYVDRAMKRLDRKNSKDQDNKLQKVAEELDAEDPDA